MRMDRGKGEQESVVMFNKIGVGWCEMCWGRGARLTVDGYQLRRRLLSAVGV